MLLSKSQRKGWTIEVYSNPTEQQQRASEIRDSGKKLLTRSVRVSGGGFSSQPQRRAAVELGYSVEYI
jgi:hypothetical protein